MGSRTMRALLAFCFVVVLQHAEAQGSDSGTATGRELQERAIQVLKDRCYRCHGGASRIAGLDVLDRAILVANRGGETTSIRWIEEGSAARSLLIDAIDGGFMPQAGSPEADAITDEERQVLRDWIDDGAAFPSRREVELVSNLQLLTAARDYLVAAPPEARRFLRFYSLAHLHNNPTISQRELRLYRAAFSKTLHCLTWRRELLLPVLVPETHESLFVIDLRDYGWDQAKIWNQILSDYPYAVGYQLTEDLTLRSVGKEIVELTQTQIPIIRADWFIVKSTQPPLYHQLLEIPETLAELEARLKIDVESNFLQQQVMRAGFSNSGVSRQNRLIERHALSGGGYFWISYDFLPRQRRSDLIRFPLGPALAEHPHPRFAFEHDGCEIIFTLPNGQQGYMLVNRRGDRVDVGPAELVFDAASSLGTPLITSGISCIHCHRNGMIEGWSDEVRRAGAVGGEVADFIRSIYPESKEINEIVRADQALFVRSLEQVCGKFLQQDEDSQRPIDQFPEPVGRVVEWYLQDLSLVDLASELGEVSAEELGNRIALDPTLQELGLKPLTSEPPASLKREKWEAEGGRSLFHQVLIELEPGVMPILTSRSNSRE